MSSVARRGAALALAAALLAAPAVHAQAVAPPERPQVLVLGDSLAVGMRPYLPAMLPHDRLVWDAATGRTTPTGLERLRADLRFVAPQAVIVSLGSNDGSSAVRFADRMRRVLRAIPAQACVVWASINRPPRKGDDSGLNRVLLRMAATHRRVTVVDWDGAVDGGVVTLPDRLHPDADGFHYRAALYAHAVKAGCRAPAAVRAS